MRNTCQMRKYMATAAALTLSAGLLIGCSRSDSSTQNAAAGTGNTGTNSSGNVVAGAGAQNTAQSETQAAAAPQTAASVQQETAAQPGAAQNVQNVPGTTTQTPQTAQQTAPAATAQTSASPEAGKQENPEPDAWEDGTEEFTGKYVKSDGTETVWITLEDDNQLTFVFRGSGIDGTAAVDGNTAVYHGDDDYTITFDQAENILIVSVEGEDGDRSPMNGIYYRDLGEDNTEDEEEDDAVYDADMAEDGEEDWDESE